MDKLIEEIKNKVESLFVEHEIIIPYSNGTLLTQIYKDVKVIDRKDDYDGVKLKIQGLKQIIDSISIQLND